MRTSTISQNKGKAIGGNGTFRAALGLVLALLLAVGAVFSWLWLPQEIADPVAPERLTATSVEPGQQAVLAYLRAHLTVLQPPMDAAQQGVEGYLRAHGVAATLSDTTLPENHAVHLVFDYR